MRVLVTGSRKWKDVGLVWAALGVLYQCWVEFGRSGGEFVVVHGKARGADLIADDWAKRMHIVDPRVRPEEHPADWDRHRNGAGHIRNKEMVQLGADFCIGFPLPIHLGPSRGTRGCLSLAAKAGIPTFNLSEAV